MSAGDQILNIRLSSQISRSVKIKVLFSDFIKRAFDVFVSSIVLVLFAPFYALIAIAIKRTSSGPVFYQGERTGRNGKPFNIIKFRTMQETAKSYDGPRITAHDDSRITPIGRWLRDTKLNEIPQFWNVLKGEMSLVGPRPEDPEFTRTWPSDLQNEILSVRPGITSPASVQYHDEEKLLSMCNVEQKYLSELSPNKMRLDQLYIRYHSFILDIDTLLWTAMMLLPRVGSYNPPEDLLFVGLFSRLISRFLNWFTIDLFTTFIAFGSIGLLYRLKGPLNIGELQAFVLTFAYAVLFSGMGVVFGTNRIHWSKANPADLFDLVPSWILATSVAFIANLFLGFFPADLILIGSVFSLFGFITFRSQNLIITHFLEQSAIFHKNYRMMREQVLIIGLGAAAQHAAWLFEHLTNSKLFHVVGFVDNDLTKQGIRLFGSNVIGKWEDIPNLVKKHDIGLIILADYRVDTKEYKELKKLCSGISARFVVMPDILASVNHLINKSMKKTNVVNIGDESIDAKCIDCLAQRTSSLM